MGLLGTWRDAIKTRLTSRIPQANVDVTTDVTSTVEANVWPSPSIFVQFENGRAGENQVIGGVLQDYTVPLNIFIAIRAGEIDNDSDLLEQAEEKASTGAFDLIDDVIEALLGFALTGEGAPHIIFQDWDQYGTANMIVVYVVRFQITNGVLKTI